MFGSFSKLSYILGERKKRLFSILFLFFVISLIDAFGIGLLSPFVSLATNPSSVQKAPFLADVLSRLDLANNPRLIAMIGLGIILIFIIQFFAYIYSQKKILDFVFDEKEIVIHRLMESYLYAPYLFHLKKNTASIVNHIISETRQYTQFMVGLMRGITNGIILIILLLLLAATDYRFLFLITATILPTVIFYVGFLGQRLKFWGKQATLTNARIIREVNHALGGLKDTKITGSEKHFLEKIDKESRKNSYYMSLAQVTQVIPTVTIRTSLIILIIGLISLASFNQEGQITDFSGTLTVFAVASLRLIPAANLLIQSYSQIKNCSFSVDVIHHDLNEIEQSHRRLELEQGIAPNRGTVGQPCPFEKTLELKDIVFRYPGSDQSAIDNLSLTLRRGEAIAFIGKSGSGKTTLVDIILGLLLIDRGDILADGQSIYSNLRGWQNRLGYIPQSIFLTDETLEQNIAFGVKPENIDPQRIQQVIRQAQLEELVENLPQGLKTEVGERGVRLSGGQRQRVGIARALYHERDILVLDEATSALDNETEKLVNEAIKSLSGNKTLIIIAHRLSTVEHCDRLYLLHQGKLVTSGAFKEVLAHYEALAQTPETV
ncbi:MAG: ATP-binding cassette domain-containing protein [Cyanobacteria bacterium RI_101]|nr:ATP-binding cassette domain-containing protein [Cyanobacteria bacterium RI_101]